MKARSLMIPLSALILAIACDKESFAADGAGSGGPTAPAPSHPLPGTAVRSRIKPQLLPVGDYTPPGRESSGGWGGRRRPAPALTTTPTDRFGFCDQTGRLVIPRRFAQVGPFREARARFLLGADVHPVLGKKWGYLDEAGKVVIDPQFDEARDFSGSLAAVRIGKKWGFIDRTGTQVVPVKYSRVGDFHEKLAWVCEGGGMSTDYRGRKSHVGGKYGYIDPTGKVVIALQFVQADDFSGGFAAVYGERTRGGTFIDKRGKRLLRETFANVGRFSEGLAPAYPRRGYGQRSAWGYVDFRGGMVIEAKYTEAQPFSEGRAAVGIRKGPDDAPIYRGFIDRNADMVIPARYAEVKRFSEGLAPVRLAPKASSRRSRWDRTPGLWGYIDKAGKTVIPAIMDEADVFRDGLAAVRFAGTRNYIDRTGRFILALPLTEPDSFRGGLARVRLNTRSTENPSYGFIDKTGRIVILPQFADAAPFAEGLAAARQRDGDPLFGYIDGTGRWIIQPRFKRAGGFSDGLAFVQDDQGKAYINRRGDVQFRMATFSHPHGFEGQQSHRFREGRLPVQVHGAEFGKSIGFIDKRGKVVIKPQFERAGAFHEGLARVRVRLGSGHSRWGFIDRDGKWVFKPDKEYGDATDFSEGIAWVTKWYNDARYLDRSGKLHLFKYNVRAYYPFRDGRSRVELAASRGWSAGTGFVDKQGKWVIKPQRYDLHDFSEGLAAFEQRIGDESLYGFMDTAGKTAIVPQFRRAGPFSEGLALVLSREGRWLYIDKAGRVKIRVAGIE